MSSSDGLIGRLSDPVDEKRDHILGPNSAPITLVEYGSYDCSHCRVANAHIAEARNRLGDRLRYVFRHRPIPDSELALRASELAEAIPDKSRFWEAHTALMTRSEELTEDDLQTVARDFGVDELAGSSSQTRQASAREHVTEDIKSAFHSGVAFTPSFFINGQRYDGPWDSSSFYDALQGTVGHRLRSAALRFANWAPSTGLLLLLFTVLAVVVTNTEFGPAFTRLWETKLGFTWGADGFALSLLQWVNDGLLTIFFLVVGLEIKREFTIGSLAQRRYAALPIAAAIGGMVVPVALYAAIVPAGPWSIGWGVSMATDTAFAVALIAMMGHRVPVELRVFLTAAAIVDDIGSIIVVALFYSGHLHVTALLGAAGVVALLAGLNRAGVYRVAPYALLGIVLWALVHEGGLHATLAGVLLALFIPTRPPPDFRALMTQADTILKTEHRHQQENALHHGPSEAALIALDAIHDRIESPADRVLRHVALRSSYVVLPIFALANAGVVISTDVIEGRSGLMLAIAVGLFLGKPLGFIAASWAAVKLGWAVKPSAYSWRHLSGAGTLAGIGFTMSLFIASQAYPLPEDFAAAKLAIFAASVVAAIAGVAVLWGAPRADAGPHP